MHVCMYGWIHGLMGACVYIYILMYVSNVCVYVLYVCMYACMYVCVYGVVCMYCMY